MLTNIGFIIKQDALVKKLSQHGYDKFLREKLTVKESKKKVTIGAAKIVKLYQIVGDDDSEKYIIIPRIYVKIMQKHFPIENKLSPINYVPVTMKGSVYDNQRLVIDKLMDNVYNKERIAGGTATCVLNMQAGLGKTFVAAGLISRLSMKTLYIVPIKPLALQAEKDLNLMLNARVCKYNKQKYNPDDHDVCIIIINSAILMPDIKFFEQYSFVIMDEVHSYCSKKRKSIFRRTCNHAVLGMSATTMDRNDGFDVIAHMELAQDGVIHADDIKNFDDDKPVFNCRAKIIRYSGPNEYTRNLTHDATGMVFTHYMYNQYLEDDHRTKMITDEIRELYENGHNIYVFAEEIKHLEKVKDRLSDVNDTHLFVGGLNELQIENIINTGRVLFSTYSYAGTGISIVKMTAIVMLTPRKSNMKQIFGRILRRGSDLTIPRIVVDIVDTKTSLSNQYRTRCEAYKKYNFVQNIHNVTYDQIEL